jgi:hypothetical protein
VGDAGIALPIAIGADLGGTAFQHLPIGAYVPAK